MSRQPRRRSDGIALVSVLWLLLLLSALAATVVAIARTNALLTHRGLELARAEAAADSAIIQTIGALSDEQPTQHPVLGDNTQTRFIDAMPVSIRVSNEAGRIDVNRASDELLLAFLQSQGVSQEHSADLVHDLREFQAADGSGGLIQPDRALQAVEELREIDSWRSEHLECWLESLTVYSQQADVNTVAATPQVFAALQWMRAHQGLDPLNEPIHPGANEVSNVGAVFRILASVKQSNDILVEREWVGRVTGETRHPALTMLWSSQQGRAPAEECQAASRRSGSP